MSEHLHLAVATPNGHALDTDCESVSAPSVYGEFGVLPGHLPLLAALKCGVLEYTQAGKTRFAAIGPGFVDAEPDAVEVLTEMFATPEEIKLDEVQKELADAQAELTKFDKDYDGPDYKELLRRADWAQAQIDTKTAADA